MHIPRHNSDMIVPYCINVTYFFFEWLNPACNFHIFLHLKTSLVDFVDLKGVGTIGPLNLCINVNN